MDMFSISKEEDLKGGHSWFLELIKLKIFEKDMHTHSTAKLMSNWQYSVSKAWNLRLRPEIIVIIWGKFQLDFF